MHAQTEVHGTFALTTLTGPESYQELQKTSFAP